MLGKVSTSSISRFLCGFMLRCYLPSKSNYRMGKRWGLAREREREREKIEASSLPTPLSEFFLPICLLLFFKSVKEIEFSVRLNREIREFHAPRSFFGFSASEKNKGIENIKGMLTWKHRINEYTLVKFTDEA